MGRIQSRRGVSGCAGEAFGVETLEPRTLLFAWSAEEVYLSELVNRARANPTAEGARLGLDLTAGLNAGELARLVAQEPLALNEALTLAARSHSLDMATRNYFGHTSPAPEYSTPTIRAQSFGYPGTAGENIAAGYSTIDAVHRAWLTSLGHRKNVLSLHTTFDSDFHYDEFGAGISFNVGGTYNHYFTETFGYQGANPVRYILGVVFDDADSNDFYGIGEGAGNVRVDVLTGNAVVGTYTTDSAGNYQIVVAPGSYTVRFTDLSTGKSLERSATVTQYNVKVDAELGDINPAALPDDHANAGQWAQATAVPIDPVTGNGTYAGRLDAPNDTDLFRFTASVTGLYRISINALSANTHVLRVFSGTQQVITTTPNGVQSPSYELTATAGATFYLRVSGNVVQINGNYLLLIEGPGPGGGGPGDDDPDDEDPIDPGEDEGSLAEASLPIGGSIMADGRFGMSYLSADLRPMFAIRNLDGTWERIDLIETAGGPGVAGKVATWTDKRDGSTYAAAVSNAGVIVYERKTDGTWSARNLSVDMNKPRIVGDLTVYVENNGRAHISGLNQGGKLVDYRMLAGRDGEGQWRWGFLNVQNHLKKRGRAMPAMAGSLTSFVTPRGSWNVVGLDVSGDIQLFFKEKKLQWDVVNLSDFAGTPLLTGRLSVEQGPDRSVSIVGVAANGNVWITGFTESAGWTVTNASQGKKAANKFRGGGLTTFTDGAGVVSIAGLNGAGKVVVYRFNSSNGKWAATVATKQVGGWARLSGVMTAMVSTDGFGVSIVGQNADGRIIRYAWSPGSTWTAEDVSALLAA